MPTFIAVIRKELSGTIHSDLGLNITVIHLAVALLAVLIGWPVSYVLGQARWAPSLAWWVYAELLVLSYLALALPAKVFETTSNIKPGDWVSYGGASPLSVQIGETLAWFLALAMWLAIALPAFLIGLILSPISQDRLLALAGFCVLFFAALIQVGTWIGVTLDSRPFRVVAVDMAYAAVMVGSLMVQAISARQSDALVLLQPLTVAAQILNVSAREAFVGSFAGTLAGLSIPAAKTVAPLSTLPWVTLITVYGAVCLVAGGLSIVMLRQWRRRSN